MITGGSTGIGLELAIRLLEKDNEVIICGRRKEKLEEAKKSYPKLHTITYNLANEDEREDLYRVVSRDYPTLNVLFHNGWPPTVSKTRYSRALV